MYLEVDRGTAELRRYGLKLRRYAHFYLSGSWRREYATFPEIRIVTAHRPRVWRMQAEVEEAVRSFRRAEHDALSGRASMVAGDVGIGVPGGSKRCSLDASALLGTGGSRCCRSVILPTPSPRPARHLRAERRPAGLRPPITIPRPKRLMPLPRSWISGQFGGLGPSARACR